MGTVTKKISFVNRLSFEKQLRQLKVPPILPAKTLKLRSSTVLDSGAVLVSIAHTTSGEDFKTSIAGTEESAGLSSIGKPSFLKIFSR